MDTSPSEGVALVSGSPAADASPTLTAEQAAICLDGYAHGVAPMALYRHIRRSRRRLYARRTGSDRDGATANGGFNSGLKECKDIVDGLVGGVPFTFKVKAAEQRESCVHILRAAGAVIA